MRDACVSVCVFLCMRDACVSVLYVLFAQECVGNGDSSPLLSVA